MSVGLKHKSSSSSNGEKNSGLCTARNSDAIQGSSGQLGHPAREDDSNQEPAVQHFQERENHDRVSPDHVNLKPKCATENTEPYTDDEKGSISGKFSSTLDPPLRDKRAPSPIGGVIFNQIRKISVGKKGLKLLDNDPEKAVKREEVGRERSCVDQTRLSYSGNPDWTLVSCDPIHCLRHVVLSAEKGPSFGFQFHSRKIPSGSAFLVSDVNPGGTAETEGQMAPGDLICSINGQPCLNLDHARAIQLVLDSRSHLNLGLLSIGHCSKRKISVSLAKGKRETWGIKLVSGTERPRYPDDSEYYIYGLTEGSVGALSGSLKLGDTLVSCNGVILKTESVTEIGKLMKSTPFVNLVLERTDFQRFAAH